MMRPFALAGLVLVSLSGCSAIAEPRVRSALVDAGVSSSDAACMAGRMVDRLSLGQLRKLEALATFDGKRRPLADYVAAVRRIGDPELVGVTASSAALCTAGLAR